MIRLAASLVTIGALSLPVLFYQDEHRKGLDRSGWKDHTYEARSLAERVARHALDGTEAAFVADDVREFGLMTADNPAQIANSSRMLSALEAGDRKGLARVAAVAIEEEDRLLPIRQRQAEANADQVQAKVTFMWVGGVVAAVLQAIQSWSWRRGQP